MAVKGISKGAWLISALLSFAFSTIPSPANSKARPFGYVPWFINSPGCHVGLVLQAVEDPLPESTWMVAAAKSAARALACAIVITADPTEQVRYALTHDVLLKVILLGYEFGSKQRDLQSKTHFP